MSPSFQFRMIKSVTTSRVRHGVFPPQNPMHEKVEYDAPSERTIGLHVQDNKSHSCALKGKIWKPKNLNSSANFLRFNDVTTFHWPHCFMSEGYSQPLVDPFVLWCQQYHLRYWHRSVSEIGQWYSGVNHSTLPLSIFFASIFGFFSFCSIRRPTVVSGLMNFSAVLRFIFGPNVLLHTSGLANLISCFFSKSTFFRLRQLQGTLERLMVSFPRVGKPITLVFFDHRNKDQWPIPELLLRAWNSFSTVEIPFLVRNCLRFFFSARSGN